MQKYFINEDEVFLINDDFSVEIKEINPSGAKVVIADNFYKNPDLVRDLALRIPPSFNERIKTRLPGGRINAFYLMDHMGPIFNNLIKYTYPEIWNKLPKDHILSSFKDATFMVNVMRSELLEPRSPHIDHPDPRAFAAMIYLNSPEECKGGTGFYTFCDEDSGAEYGLYKKDNGSNTPVYINGNMGDWKMTQYVEMKYNRMVLYQSKYYHSAFITPEMFTNGTYRLNQMFFI